MTEQELHELMMQIDARREETFQRLMGEGFTRDELDAAEEFLKMYGNGKTDLRQAATGLRQYKASKSKAKRVKYLVCGALRAIHGFKG